MDRETSARFAGLINSYSIILVTLINRLHANGALSRPQFCDELTALSNKLKADWSDPEPYNLHVINSLADTLRSEDPYKTGVQKDLPLDIYSANDDAPENK